MGLGNKSRDAGRGSSISSHRPAQAEGLPENTNHTPWRVEKETDASDSQNTVQRKDTEVEDVVLQGARSVSCVECGPAGAPSRFSRNVPRSELTKKCLSKG